MYNKIKDIIKKKSELLTYIIAGVATTLVNWIAYFIFRNFFSPTVSNIIAWTVSVVFAYVINSRFVFNTKAVSFVKDVKMFIEFSFARVASGVIESLSIFVFVEKLMCDDLIVKIIMGIFVIIFNYIVSKLWIFRKK